MDNKNIDNNNNLQNQLLGSSTEQSNPPSEQIYSIQNNNSPKTKSSKWAIAFFVILAFLLLMGVGLFFIIISSVAGKTGSEYVVLLLFITIVPFVGVVAVINLIGLPLYLRKKKTRGIGLVVAIISLSISGLIALYVIYFVVVFAIASTQVSQRFEAIDEKAKTDYQQYITDNAKPEITKEEAITLLKNCKLKGFYYTQETEIEHGTSPASSKTGVVLTKIDGEPYRISIADKLVSELVPIAREAQKKCVSPQFWHDGNYEQYKDGKWYFNNQVVNTTQTVKTKA